MTPAVHTVAESLGGQYDGISWRAELRHPPGCKDGS